jgi:hypothetical protein
MVLLDQEFLRHLLKGENGLFSHKVNEQPLECSKDELSPCKSVSGLFLCMLIDEQEFHFENWILCKTHKYREESYIVPEELVSYLQSLYLVLLFSLILQQK